MKPPFKAIEKPAQNRMFPQSKIENRKSKIAAVVLFVLLQLSTFNLQPATVLGSLVDLHLSTLSTPLTFYPTNIVLVSGSGALSAGPAATVYPTNGLFSTVLDAGPYTVCLTLNNWRNCFTITVPGGTNSYNITNLLSQKILADDTGGAILADP